MDPIQVLTFSAPVALAALGESVTQKAGVIHIGLEGTMLAAGYGAMTATYFSHSPWLGLAMGLVVGLVSALINGWFCIRLAADQVVVGAAWNLLALGVTGTLFRAQFGQTGRLLSVEKVPSLAGLDPVLWFLLLSVPLLTWGLARTGWGLALRAVGQAPRSVEAAGWSVERLRMSAMLVGGLFAGLAGAYLSLGIAGSFAEGMTGGRGFMAIAMVTFGRWKPVGVFFASLLIGAAEAVQYVVQGGAVEVSAHLLIAVPYVLALAVLALTGKGSLAPKALGRPYRREG